MKATANMVKSSGHRRQSGLTVIEILVALALLGIVAAALVGSFSLLTSVNRDSSTDVDLSRVVRSVSEKIVDDWEDFTNYDDELVSGFTLNEYMVEATGSRCTAATSKPDVDTVKLVTISCAGSGNLDDQTYYVEVGDPQP